MANFYCIGCKYRFTSQRAFGSHQRHCKIKIRDESARLLELRASSLKEADKKRHPSDGSESIHDDKEDGSSGYQPTVEEEMTVDQV